MRKLPSRYIAMTCHTDNAEAEKAYLHFVENIEPQLKPRQFELAKIYRRASAARTDNCRTDALSKFLTAT